MPAIASNLAINENKDAAWDAGAAKARIKDWATDSDGNVDFKKYAKAFLYCAMAGASEKLGDYKLPIADIVDGNPKVFFKAIVAVMAVLNGGRGGADLGNDREAVYAQVKKYYSKFGETAPELKAITEMEERNIGERIVFNAAFEPTKIKDLGDGTIEAVITSNAMDHQGERINMDGVDTSTYHGTVLYGHDYEGLPIGKTLNLTKQKSKIKAKFQLAVEEYPFANLVYKMIKGGYLTDVSIGGLVRKWSDDYTTVEELVMKEFSVVPIGANPEAMITAAKSMGVDTKEFKKEYQDFARTVLLDKLEKMPDDELKDAIKVLKSLVARLEETAEAPSLTDEKHIKRIKHVILDDAKAVATQSQRVIKTIKVTL